MLLWEAIFYVSAKKIDRLDFSRLWAGNLDWNSHYLYLFWCASGTHSAGLRVRLHGETQITILSIRYAVLEIAPVKMRLGRRVIRISHKQNGDRLAGSRQCKLNAQGFRDKVHNPG